MKYNKRTPKNLLLRKIYQKGANFFLMLIVGVSICITSCNESSVIGLKVQPANDLLNIAYIDTTTLQTKTVRADSLRTDEILIYTRDALLGKYVDQTFGTSSASLYTQLRLTTNAPVFGTNPIIDSVVLCLVYDTTRAIVSYGKKARAEQKINVFALVNDINSTSNYYSVNTIVTDLFDLANNHKFIPKPTDSIIDSVKLKPQLRVPLVGSIWQALLDNPGDLTDNLTFQTLHKGLYITTENTTGLLGGDGNILHFKMADLQSKLVLYYHNSLHNSLHYDLSLGSVARFSHFSHDYSTVDPNLAQQLGTNPPKQNDVVFIQGMAGLKTKIDFPYLMNWIKSGPIVVNKAELVIKVNVDATYQLDTFAAPAQLVLFGINDDGTNYLLPDAGEIGIQGAGYVGGSYNSTTHEYRFNIARYVQQVLTGKLKNNGIHLVALNGALNANRVVIGGGGAGSGYRMKLNIAYTKLH